MSRILINTILRRTLKLVSGNIIMFSVDSVQFPLENGDVNEPSRNNKETASENTN